MNYMITQELLKLRELSGLVGDFIRYWGFRRIHGQIWAVLYLSKKSLSGVELVEFLGVSKALVSPALQELQDEGLIKEVESENQKTKRYAAVEDATSVIREVLRRREKPLMESIVDRHHELASEISEGGFVDADRFAKVGSLIQTAHLSLLTLLEADDLWK